MTFCTQYEGDEISHEQHISHIRYFANQHLLASYTLFKSTTPPILKHAPFKLEVDFILYSIAARLKLDLYQLL